MKKIFLLLAFVSTLGIVTAGTNYSLDNFGIETTSQDGNKTKKDCCKKNEKGKCCEMKKDSAKKDCSAHDKAKCEKSKKGDCCKKSKHDCSKHPKGKCDAPKDSTKMQAH